MGYNIIGYKTKMSIWELDTFNFFIEDVEQYLIKTNEYSNISIVFESLTKASIRGIPNSESKNFNYVMIQNDNIFNGIKTYWFIVNKKWDKNLINPILEIEIDSFATFGKDVFIKIYNKKVKINRAHMNRYKYIWKTKKLPLINTENYNHNTHPLFIHWIYKNFRFILKDGTIIRRTNMVLRKKDGGEYKFYLEYNNDKNKWLLKKENNYPINQDTKTSEQFDIIYEYIDNLEINIDKNKDWFLKNEFDNLIDENNINYIDLNNDNIGIWKYGVYPIEEKVDSLNRKVSSTINDLETYNPNICFEWESDNIRLLKSSRVFNLFLSPIKMRNINQELYICEEEILNSKIKFKQFIKRESGVSQFIFKKQNIILNKQMIKVEVYNNNNLQYTYVKNSTNIGIKPQNSNWWIWKLEGNPYINSYQKLEKRWKWIENDDFIGYVIENKSTYIGNIQNEQVEEDLPIPISKLLFIEYRSESLLVNPINVGEKIIVEKNIFNELLNINLSFENDWKWEREIKIWNSNNIKIELNLAFVNETKMFTIEKVLYHLGETFYFDLQMIIGTSEHNIIVRDKITYPYESLTINSFVATSSSQWEKYYNDNLLSIKEKQRQIRINEDLIKQQASFGLATSIFGGLSGIVTSVGSGAYLGNTLGVGRNVGMGLGGIFGLGNATSTIGGGIMNYIRAQKTSDFARKTLEASYQDLKRRPNTNIGNSKNILTYFNEDNLQFVTSEKYNNLLIIRKTNDEVLKQQALYYHMFGYKINGYYKFDETLFNRSIFNFLEMENFEIYLDNYENEIIEDLKNRFKEGVRMWEKLDQFQNFNLENWEKTS